MKKLKLSQGFTLIELITVMVIISIIAGLLVGAGGAARRKARENKAKSMILSLEIAIGMYHANTNSYPPAGGPGGSTTYALYDHLTDTDYGDPNNPSYIQGWNGPYMEFKSDDIKGVPWQIIVDPWKKETSPYGEYKYDVSPAWGNTTSYNLWSCGPDGNDDSSDGNTDYGDDIYNW